MKLYLEALALSVIAVFAPVKAVMITAGVLVLSDLIVGLWAATKRKEAIESSGLRRTVTKTVVYQVAIMVGFITERYLLGDLIPVGKLIGGMIGVVELKSILESLNEINGTPVFSSIVTKLGSANDTKSPK